MAKMNDNKVNGPEGMRDDQDFAFGNDLHYCEVFPGPLHGSDGCSRLVEDCETVFFAKTRCTTEEGNQEVRSQQEKLSTSTGVCDKPLTKHWEWQDERSPMLRHGSVIRPTNVHGKLGHQDSFRRGQTEDCGK